MISHSCVDDCCSCVFDSSLMMRRSISQYSIGCIVFYNIQYSTVQYSIVQYGMIALYCCTIIVALMVH
jgi:hypothetical protein